MRQAVEWNPLLEASADHPQESILHQKEKHRKNQQEKEIPAREGTVPLSQRGASARDAVDAKDP